MRGTGRCPMRLSMLTLDQWDAQRQSIGTRYALHDLSACALAMIKGELLTRLVQLALRGILGAEPLDRL